MSNSNDIKVKIGLDGAKKFVADMGRSADAVESLEKSFANLKGAVIGLGAISGAKAMAESLITAQVHAQQIRFTLQAAAGSAEGAGKEFDYVAATAERLGVNLSTTAEEYGKFLISAKSANVSLATTRNLFQSVAEASTVFHLSAQQTSSAMLALEQMMAQGAIRTQELRLQLGQALPGVYENFMNRVKAKGLDFNAMLQSGKLEVREFSDELAAAVRDAYKQDDVKAAAEGLNAQINRMKNAIFQFQTNISGGLFEESAAHTVKSITNMMVAFQDVSKEFGPLASTLAVGGTAFYAYSKAMNAVSDAGSNFITSAKTRVDALLNERANTLAATQATAAKAAATLTASAATTQATAKEAVFVEVELRHAQSALNVAKAEMQAARAQVATGLSTDLLTQKEAALIAAERALAAAKANNAKMSAAVIAAMQAETVAAAELGAATTKAATAQAAMGRGNKIGATVMKGLTSAASGVLSLIGGWTGALVLAGFAAKGVYDWVSASGDAAEKALKAFEAIGNGERQQSSTEQYEARVTAIKDAKAASEALSETYKKEKKQLEEIEAVIAGDGLLNKHIESVLTVATLGANQIVLNGLKTKLAYDEENLRTIEKKVEAEKKIAEFQEKQQEALKKINELGIGSAEAFKEFTSDSFLKENRKLAASNEARRKKLLGTGGVGDEMISDLQDARAESTKKLAEAQAALNKAEQDGTATQEQRLALENAVTEATKKDGAATLQLYKNIKLREAAEDLSKREKYHAAYLKYLTERVKWEDALNERLATRQLAAASEDSTLNDRELKLKKDLFDLNEQYRKDVMETTKIDPETKLPYAGKDAGAKQAGYVKQFADTYEKAIAKTKGSYADSEETLRRKNRDDFEKSMEDVRKVTIELEKAQATGNLTYAETISLQTQLSSASRQVAENINDMGQGTDEAIRATQEFAEAQKPLIARLKEVAAATRGRGLEQFQLGLASQAGSVTAGDAIARSAFEDQTKSTLAANGLTPGSPEWVSQMDTAMGYYAQIENKTKGLTTAYEDLANAFGSFTNQLINTDWVEKAQAGPEAIAKAFSDMIQQILQEIVRTQILKMVKILTDGLVSMGVKSPTSTAATGPAATTGLAAYGGSATPTGMASGGHVSGPGTGRSDSIPAMLSNGEYVVNAAAVRKYGTGFMDSLNDSKLRVARPMKLAAGGVVGAAAMGKAAEPKVNVINATGQQVDTAQGEGINGEKIVNVVVGKVAESIRRNGIVGKTIQNAYGARRVGKK